MKQKIIIAGGSGFLGSALARTFTARDHEVVVLTRSPKPRSDGVKEIRWDAKNLGEWASLLDGADVAINLTGKSVDCRYTQKNRRAIIESRVSSTRAIGEAIARCAKPPRVWLNASSATLYKHVFDRAMDENGETGATPDAKDQFSIEVIRQWERALEEAHTPNTRKIALRITMVFGPNGGVFPVLRRLTRFGLGGRMGNGRQLVSWIHEEDFCRAIEWLMQRDDLAGPINLAAPNPLTNAEMMQMMRKVFNAPFGLPATEWMLEIGAFFLRTETELILKSRRVVPGKLLVSGFEFHFPTLENALRNLQQRKDG
ncbi:MAG TPA: TIGR01777 family oxidoreductase [Candidatus Angelobacter sp.]|nr:TIGR01777 family oxidoreductase [Candidatus Angelobacter sp.]